MTMSVPGRVPAMQQQQQTLKRYGVMRMAVDSDHIITIRPAEGAPRRMQVRVRDRRLHPKAKSVVICLSPACLGRTWPNEEAMLRDHPDQVTMERQQEIHVYGWWSDDPAGSKQHGCAACKSSKEGPCEAHHGGALGLLSSGD